MIDLTQLATNILVSTTTAGVTLHFGLKNSKRQRWWDEKWNAKKLAIKSLIRMERYAHSYLCHMEHSCYGGVAPADNLNEQRREWQEGCSQVDALVRSGALLLSARSVTLLGTLRRNMLSWREIEDSVAEAELEVEAIGNCLAELVIEAK